MASKKKSGAPKGRKKKSAAETRWTTGTNPKPVDAATAQEAIVREKHGKPYTRELPMEATAAELSLLAHELADVLDEEALVKKQRRDAMAGFREKLSAFDDRKKKLAECVKTDRKLEQVKVQEFIRSDNLIEVVREDTGEVVESRAATSDDLQREIQAAGVHEKASHKPLVDADGDADADAEEEEDEDDLCPECGGENDVHDDGCSHVKAKGTEPAPPPEGTETGDLAAETAST